jgi:glycosyltransferase involved in cell wall biosynthesis
MVIGIVAPFHQLGGSESQILLLIRGLQKRGVEVTLFHFSIEQEALRRKLDQCRGLQTRVIAGADVRRPIRLLRETGTLADVVTSRGIQVLHCWNYTGHIVGGLAAHRAGVPAVYSIRGLDPWKKPWQMPFYRAVNSFASAFVFQSETTRDIICARERIRKTTLTRIIPNGLDFGRFRPSRCEQSRARLLEELGCPPDVSVILSVGSLRSIKGHDVLLEAVRIVRSARADIAFHVVIAGDGPLRAEYQRQAEGLPVSLIGFRDDTEALYNAADVYCQPSRSEAMPNSVIEAMSCGLPIVASRVGAVGELVTPANGRLFEAGDANALARNLVELLSDRAALCGMSAVSLGAARHFSVDRMIDAHIDVYSALAAA